MGSDDETETENSQLHVIFFPFMAHGHMIPMVDMTKLFAMKGVKTTIVTTPLNLPFMSTTIQRSKTLDIDIDIDVKILNFPCVEAGLPEGCENFDSIASSPAAMDMIGGFFKAAELFREPFELLLQDCKPDCLVVDMFFTWASDVANKFQIPRLLFSGFGFFSSCISDSIYSHAPQRKVESDTEPFVIPNLPGDIKLTRNKMPAFSKQAVEKWRDAELKSYGIIVNSFYELEATYVEHYRNVLGRKAWHVGPVSLCNRAMEDKADRGKKPSIDEHECLKWLDSKQPESVVYVCFGSAVSFQDAQLKEIAFGIEATEQQFIWVVNKNDDDDWLPQGFEKRTEGKGLIIRGWAPQVLILDHQAIGAFVTHCGWNSILEGVSAGLPMVTWPVFAEQFYNEKLVIEVLRIGVGVEVVGDFVTRDDIEKAVKEIMVGDKTEEMRRRAKVLGEMAKRAVEEGGSSFSDLNNLIQELKSRLVDPKSFLK